MNFYDHLLSANLLHFQYLLKTTRLNFAKTFLSEEGGGRLKGVVDIEIVFFFHMVILKYVQFPQSLCHPPPLNLIDIVWWSRIHILFKQKRLHDRTFYLLNMDCDDVNIMFHSHVPVNTRDTTNDNRRTITREPISRLCGNSSCVSMFTEDSNCTVHLNQVFIGL